MFGASKSHFSVSTTYQRLPRNSLQSIRFLSFPLLCNKIWISLLCLSDSNRHSKHTQVKFISFLSSFLDYFYLAHCIEVRHFKPQMRHNPITPNNKHKRDNKIFNFSNFSIHSIDIFYVTKLNARVVIEIVMRLCLNPINTSLYSICLFDFNLIFVATSFSSHRNQINFSLSLQHFF